LAVTRAMISNPLGRGYPFHFYLRKLKMRQLQPGALLVLDWRCLTGARFLAKINGDSERGSLGNTMIKLLIVGLGVFAGASMLWVAWASVF